MSRPAVEVREVQLGDSIRLADKLRAQDRDELDAAGHTNHRRIIAESVASSEWCRTALVDGELACIFGLARGGSLLSPFGVPWMLGTDLVPKHRRVLARLAPAYIREMLRTYPHLANTVHARNTVAVRWLKRVGFTFGQEFQHPETGEPFILFEMRNV